MPEDLPFEPDNPGIKTLTREEGLALIDKEAHKYLGMSGDEFIRAWKAGKIKDPDRPEVLRVAMLLPFAYSHTTKNPS